MIAAATRFASSAEAGLNVFDVDQFNDVVVEQQPIRLAQHIAQIMTGIGTSATMHHHCWQAVQHTAARRAVRRLARGNKSFQHLCVDTYIYMELTSFNRNSNGNATRWDNFLWHFTGKKKQKKQKKKLLMIQTKTRHTTDLKFLNVFEAFEMDDQHRWCVLHVHRFARLLVKPNKQQQRQRQPWTRVWSTQLFSTTHAHHSLATCCIRRKRICRRRPAAPLH